MNGQGLGPGWLPGEKDSPDRFYSLPELHYPHSLNVTRELLDANVAGGRAGRVALRYQDEQITYRELLGRVNRLAHGFLRLGIRPGDRVLLRLANRPELVVSILALLRIGAVAVPTYPPFRSDDIVYRENDTEAVAVVVSGDLLEEVERGRENRRFVRHLVVVPRRLGAGQIAYTELVEAGSEELAPAATHRDDPAFIMYTSGTTGEPKGACHSHRDVLSSADSYARYCLRPSAEDVFGSPAPIPFSFGLGFLVIFPLRFGASAVLTESPTPASAFRAIERHRITIFAAVPTFYKMMLLEESGQAAGTGSLRCALTGGEPLLGAIARQWQERFGLPLIQFLGTTELFHVFASYRLGLDQVRQGSFGRAVPGYAVVVRDPDTFNEQPPNTPGLLTAKGPTGTRYWRKPETQRDAVRNGWNVVRDIVTMDEDGYLYHIARADEIIVSAGHNIAPSQVEELILRHPAVSEVACAGAPDPDGIRSSIVKAFVVVRLGIEASESLKSDIQTFVKENGPPYLYPRSVEFVPELPKTLTGKIKRSLLVQRADRVRRG